MFANGGMAAIDTVSGLTSFFDIYGNPSPTPTGAPAPSGQRYGAYNPITNQMLVTTGTSDKVVVFQNGHYLGSFGSAGSGPGQFNNVQGITVDPRTGDIYTADSNNGRIEVFSANWTYLRSYPAPYAFDIAYDPYNGTLLAPDGTSIQMLNPQTGAVVSQFTGPNGEGIAVNAITGQILISAGFANKIALYSPTGVLQGYFGSGGTSPGQFELPWSVDVNPGSGEIGVGDTFNKRVSLWWDPSQWVQPGTANLTALSLAQALTLNPGYNLVVNPPAGSPYDGPVPFGSVELQSGGVLTLAGGNFQAQQLILNDGTVIDRANTTLGMPITVEGGGTIEAAPGDTLTVDNISSSTNAYEIGSATDDGTVAIHNSTGYADLYGGTLQIGANGSPGYINWLATGGNTVVTGSGYIGDLILSSELRPAGLITSKYMFVNGYGGASLSFSLAPGWQSGQVAIAPGGAMYIAGSVPLNISAQAGSYPVKESWHLIQGSLRGTFQSVNVAGLTGYNWNLVYSSSGVDFNIIAPHPFTESGQSPIVTQVAEILNTSVPLANGPLLTKLNEIYALPPAAMNTVLSQITGQQHANAPAVLSGTLLSSWRPIFRHMGVDSVTLPRNGDPWVEADEGWGHTGTDGYVAGNCLEYSGWLFGDDWRAGPALLGYSVGQTSIGVTSDDAGGNLSTRLWQGALYATAHLPYGKLGILAGAADGRVDFTANTLVGSANGSDSLEQNMLSLRGSLDPVEFGYGMTIQPHAALTYSHERVSSMTETGSLGALAAIVPGKTFDLTDLEGGMKVRRAWRVPNATLAVTVDGGFKHRLSETRGGLMIRFAGIPNAPFLVLPILPDTTVGFVNLDLALFTRKNVRAGVDWYGQFGPLTTINSVAGYLAWTF